MSSPVLVTLTATANGVTKTMSVYVTPPTIQSLVIDPSTIQWDGEAIVTVTLASPAPAGGATFGVSSTEPAYIIPSVGQITIPQGQYSATFVVGASFTSEPITGSVLVGLASADVTVMP